MNGLAELEKLSDSRLARVKELVVGLEDLKAAYRAKFGAGVGRRCVPAQSRIWTPADRQEVLYGSWSASATTRTRRKHRTRRKSSSC